MATEANIPEDVSAANTGLEERYSTADQLDSIPNKCPPAGSIKPSSGLNQYPQCSDCSAEAENKERVDDVGDKTINVMTTSTSPEYNSSVVSSSSDKSGNCQEIVHQELMLISENERQNQEGVESKDVETRADKVEAINDINIEEHDHDIENDGANISRLACAEEPTLKVHEEETSMDNSSLDQHLELNTNQHASIKVIPESMEKEMITSQTNENTRSKGEEDADLEFNKQATSIFQANLGLINEALLPNLDLTTKSQGEEEERLMKSCIKDEDIDSTIHAEDENKEMSFTGVQSKKAEMPSVLEGERKDPESIRSSFKLEHDNDSEYKLMHESTEDASTVKVAQSPYVHSVEEYTFEAASKNGDNDDDKLENPCSNLATDAASTQGVAIEAGETLPEASYTACKDKNKDVYESIWKEIDVPPVDRMDKVEDSTCLNRDVSGANEEDIIQTGVTEINENSKLNPEEHDGEKKDSWQKNEQEDHLQEQVILIPEKTEIASLPENAKNKVEQNIHPLDKFEDKEVKDEPTSTPYSGETLFSSEKNLPLVESITKINSEEMIFPQKTANDLNSKYPLVEETGQPDSGETHEVSKPEPQEKNQESIKFCAENNKQDEHHSETQSIENLIIKYTDSEAMVTTKTIAKSTKDTEELEKAPESHSQDKIEIKGGGKIIPEEAKEREEATDEQLYKSAKESVSEDEAPSRLPTMVSTEDETIEQRFQEESLKDGESTLIDKNESHRPENDVEENNKVLEAYDLPKTTEREDIYKQRIEGSVEETMNDFQDNEKKIHNSREDTSREIKGENYVPDLPSEFIQTFNELQCDITDETTLCKSNQNVENPQKVFGMSLEIKEQSLLGEHDNQTPKEALIEDPDEYDHSTNVTEDNVEKSELSKGKDKDVKVTVKYEEYLKQMLQNDGKQKLEEFSDMIPAGNKADASRETSENITCTEGEESSAVLESFSKKEKMEEPKAIDGTKENKPANQEVPVTTAASQATIEQILKLCEPSEAEASVSKPEEVIENTVGTWSSTSVGMKTGKEYLEDESDETKMKKEVKVTESRGQIEASYLIERKISNTSDDFLEPKEDHGALTSEENKNSLVKDPSSISGVLEKDSCSTNDFETEFLRVVGENKAMKEVKPVNEEQLEGSDAATEMMDLTTTETKSNSLGSVDIAERQEEETNSEENRDMEVGELVDQGEKMSHDIKDKALITSMNHEKELTISNDQLVHTCIDSSMVLSKEEHKIIETKTTVKIMARDDILSVETETPLIAHTKGASVLGSSDNEKEKEKECPNEGIQRLKDEDQRTPPDLKTENNISESDTEDIEKGKKEQAVGLADKKEACKLEIVEDEKSTIEVTKHTEVFTYMNSKKALLQEEEVAEKTDDSSAVIEVEREAAELKAGSPSSEEESANTKNSELLMEKGTFVSVARDQSEETLFHSSNNQTEGNGNNIQDQDPQSVQQVIRLKFQGNAEPNMKPRCKDEDLSDLSQNQDENTKDIMFTQEVHQRLETADNNESIKGHLIDGRIRSPGEETGNEVNVSTSEFTEEIELTELTEEKNTVTLEDHTEQNKDIIDYSALKSTDASETCTKDSSSTSKVYEKETEAEVLKKDDPATDDAKNVFVIFEIEETDIKKAGSEHEEYDKGSDIASESKGVTEIATNKTTLDSTDTIEREEENFNPEKKGNLEESSEGRLRIDFCVEETDKTTTVQHQRELGTSSNPMPEDYPATVYPIDDRSIREEITGETAENQLPEKEQEVAKPGGVSELESVDITNEGSNEDIPKLENEGLHMISDQNSNNNTSSIAYHNDSCKFDTEKEEKLFEEASKCTASSTFKDSEPTQGQEKLPTNFEGSLKCVAIEKAATALETKDSCHERESTDEFSSEKTVEAADTNEKVELASEPMAVDRSDENLYQAKEKSNFEDQIFESRECIPAQNFQSETHSQTAMQFEVEHHISVPRIAHETSMTVGCTENVLKENEKAYGSENILEYAPKPKSNLKEPDTLSAGDKTVNVLQVTAINSQFIEQTEKMDLVKERESRILENLAKANEDFSSLTTIEASEEGIHSEESKKTLLRKFSFESQGIQKDIKAEIFNKDSTNTFETLPCTLVGVETGLNEIIEENRKWVDDSVAIPERKDVTTADKASSDTVDTDNIQEENSNSEDSREKQIPEIVDEGGHEMDQDTRDKAPTTGVEHEKEGDTSLTLIPNDNLQNPSLMQTEDDPLQNKISNSIDNLERDDQTNKKAETAFLVHTEEKKLPQINHDVIEPELSPELGITVIEKDNANKEIQKQEDEDLHDLNSQGTTKDVEVFSTEKGSGVTHQNGAGTLEEVKEEPCIEASNYTVDFTCANDEKDAESLKIIAVEKIATESDPGGQSNKHESTKTEKSELPVKQILEPANLGEKFESASDSKTHDETNEQLPQTKEKSKNIQDCISEFAEHFPRAKFESEKQTNKNAETAFVVHTEEKKLYCEVIEPELSLGITVIEKDNANREIQKQEDEDLHDLNSQGTTKDVEVFSTEKGSGVTHQNGASTLEEVNEEPCIEASNYTVDVTCANDEKDAESLKIIDVEKIATESDPGGQSNKHESTKTEKSELPAEQILEPANLGEKFESASDSKIHDEANEQLPQTKEKSKNIQDCISEFVEHFPGAKFESEKQRKLEPQMEAEHLNTLHAKETSVTSLTTKEVHDGVDKADGSENIEQIRNSEVKDDKLISTQDLKATDSGKHTAIVDLSIEDDPTITEVSSAIEAFEENMQDKGDWRPLDDRTGGPQALEGKIEKKIEAEGDSCINRTETTPVEVQNAESSTREALLDNKPLEGSNLNKQCPETIKIRSSLETEEVIGMEVEKNSPNLFAQLHHTALENAGRKISFPENPDGHLYKDLKIASPVVEFKDEDIDVSEETLPVENLSLDQNEEETKGTSEMISRYKTAGVEAISKDKTIYEQFLQEGNLNEKLQTQSSALLTRKQEQETGMESKKTEKNSKAIETLDYNFLNTKTSEETCLGVENSIRITVSDSGTKIYEDSQRDSSSKFHEKGRAPDVVLQLQLHEKGEGEYIDSLLQSKQIKEATESEEAANLKTSERAFEDVQEVPSYEVLTEMEDKEKHLKAALTNLQPEENWSEITAAAGKTINTQVSDEKIKEEKEAAKDFQQIYVSERDRTSHQETELSTIEFSIKKTNEASQTISNDNQHEVNTEAMEQREYEYIEDNLPDDTEGKNFIEAATRLTHENRGTETNITGGTEIAAQGDKELGEFRREIEKLGESSRETVDPKLTVKADVESNRYQTRKTDEDVLQVPQNPDEETIRKVQPENAKPRKATWINTRAEGTEVGEEKGGHLGERLTEKSTSIDAENISSSNNLQKSTEEPLQAATHLNEATELTASTEETKTQKAETPQFEEAKIESEKEDGGGESRTIDPLSGASVMVETSKDVEVKVVHLDEATELASSTEETKTQKAEIPQFEEAKMESKKEGEGGDESRKIDPLPGASVMVETSKDADVKVVHLDDATELAASTEETKTQMAETPQFEKAKIESEKEDEGGDESRKIDPLSGASVMVETSKDVEVKVVHLDEATELASSTEETKTQKAETPQFEEAKMESEKEGEGGDESRKIDPLSGASVMVVKVVHLDEATELAASTEETKTQKAETPQFEEAKMESEKEGEGGDESRKIDPLSGASVMVETSKDAEVKVVHLDEATELAASTEETKTQKAETPQFEEAKMECEKEDEGGDESRKIDPLSGASVMVETSKDAEVKGIHLDEATELAASTEETKTQKLAASVMVETSKDAEVKGVHLDEATELAASTEETKTQKAEPPQFEEAKMESEKEDEGGDESRKIDPLSGASAMVETSKDAEVKVVHLDEATELAASTEEKKTQKAETPQFEEAKVESEKEDEGGDESRKIDPLSGASVMVETSKDAEVKVVHKKSHNILSGVGSKVKHSISKVKKAITGKSSHRKTPSPK